MIQNFIRTYPNLFSIILFALLLQSCKKSDQVASPEKELSSLERKFFFTNRTGDLTECKLVDFLIRQNRSKSFVEKTTKIIGFPRWEKMITLKRKSGISGRGASDSLLTTYFVPFVRDSQNYVNASLIISVYPNDTTFAYRSDWEYQYKTHGSPAVDSTAEAHAVFFMFLDNRTFGYTEFYLTDDELFPLSQPIIGGKKKLSFLSISTQSTGKGQSAGYYENCVDFYVCGSPSSPTCTGPSGCDYLNCSLPPGSPGYCYLVTTVCVGGWQDPTGGSSGSTGSGSSTGSGGGGGSPDPCGSISPQKNQTASLPCGPGWNGIGLPNSYTIFIINGVTFTTLNYPGINNGLPWRWWENASILAPFGGLSYGAWAINFLSLNPQLPFSAFQNLFMTPSEGPEEGDPDESFWNNPNTTFLPQPLPSWGAFENAFPKSEYYTKSQVWALIGGEVGTIVDSSANTCAARVSRALNYSGVIIPHIPMQTFQGSDGKYYFLMAMHLNRWMRKTFGCANPNLSIGEYLNTNSLHFTNNTINNLSELLSRPSNTIKGIFSAVWDYPTGSTTGHADLLNSISPWCDGRCHLNEKHKYIDIWPLQ